MSREERVQQLNRTKEETQKAMHRYNRKIQSVRDTEYELAKHEKALQETAAPEERAEKASKIDQLKHQLTLFRSRAQAPESKALSRQIDENLEQIAQLEKELFGTAPNRTSPEMLQPRKP
jgi:hypothetical protein